MRTGGLNTKVAQTSGVHRLPLILGAAVLSFLISATSVGQGQVRVWEKQEIELAAERIYSNPYTDVEVWIDLKGPNFEKRVYGFWDGGKTFRVRFVATEPGAWTWTSASLPADAGLQNKTGTFTAMEWSEREKRVNPNRRGFVRSTANGRALSYADGTPFFYLADTWWACSTWRYPWKGKEPERDYVPGPGIGFEEAVQFRKSQGYNGVAMIASFPSWQTEGPSAIRDEEGTPLRQAWNIGDQCALMPDEGGNPPFLFPGKVQGYETIVPDFDRIKPEYFRRLDLKMQHLSDQGFVPFFESTRRDQAPAWKKYYDWPASYIRYLQYLLARYGCYNLIFSGIHADVLAASPGRTWLTGQEWNHVLTKHFRRYGPPPFGQISSTNISLSTYQQYGHGNDAPWLTLHGVGNQPRDHRLFVLLEEMFALPYPKPMLNNEPFYPYSINPQASRIHGDQEANNRACAYGCVLNGALAGHIYGTQGYYVTTGEPRQKKPYVWEGLAGEKFMPIGRQMGYLKEFILSEGPLYYELLPDRDSLDPNQKSEGLENWYLSGWSSLMRTADARLLKVYFEVDCPIATVRNLPAGANYSAKWFDPRTGEWILVKDSPLKVGQDGTLPLPGFPDGAGIAEEDWALKMVRRMP